MGEVSSTIICYFVIFLIFDVSNFEQMASIMLLYFSFHTPHWHCTTVQQITFGPTSQKMETHYKTSSGHQRALVPWFLKKKKK